MAECTPLTVVPRSSTTAAMDTFMDDVSTTSTNIAIARRMARRRARRGQPAPSAAGSTGAWGARRLWASGAQDLRLLRRELGVGEDALVAQVGQSLELGDDVGGGRGRGGRRRCRVL